MPLSFGLNRPIEATADIVALTGTVGYLIYITSQIDEVAAWCLAPYLAWLSFATYLSVSIIFRSPKGEACSASDPRSSANPKHIHRLALRISTMALTPT